MKRFLFLLCFCGFYSKSYCWGFFAHKKINYYAVFLLPPQMLVLYKPNITFLSEHATDPDKRRYTVKDEAPRHYIDIDHYGKYPYSDLPRNWDQAVSKYGKDSLMAYGIGPWHIQVMLARLTSAFREKDFGKIMRNSAEIGHYIADAHVPLHANTNHNGQFTGQQGIHAFWESRVPELLADKEFDFFIGHAQYIKDPATFIWEKVMESGNAADSVLEIEKELTRQFRPDMKYAFEERNSLLIRQYSTAYSIAYNNKLNGMIERRMRQSVFCVASFWYTAWVNAGQPDLSNLAGKTFLPADLQLFETLNQSWKNNKIIGREHDE